MRSETFEVATGTTMVTDITREVADFVAGDDGLVNVFVPHATAGVALIELGSGTEADLAAILERIMPSEDLYRHRHGSIGHGRDHVMPALVSPSLSIPAIGGRLALGTWQSIALVDPNVDNPIRTVRLSFIGA